MKQSASTGQQRLDTVDQLDKSEISRGARHPDSDRTEIPPSTRQRATHHSFLILSLDVGYYQLLLFSLCLDRSWALQDSFNKSEPPIKNVQHICCSGLQRRTCALGPRNAPT